MPTVDSRCGHPHCDVSDAGHEASPFGLGALSPTARIAPAVKHGDDHQAVVVLAIEDGVREATQASPPGLAQQDGVGLWKLLYPRERILQRRAKLVAKAHPLVLVPSVRFQRIELRLRAEDDRLHLEEPRI